MDLAAFSAPLFSRLSVSQVFECLQAKLDRRDEEQFWMSYIALTVPKGCKKVPTFEELNAKRKRRSHTVTDAEIQRAEEVGRDTARAFGML